MITKQKNKDRLCFIVCLIGVASCTCPAAMLFSLPSSILSLKASALACATCGCSSSSKSHLFGDQWRWQILECNGKPIGRHETAFVEIDGLFYLIGGREAKGNIECFDYNLGIRNNVNG